MKAEKDLDIYFYIAGWIVMLTGALYLFATQALSIPLLQAATPCLFFSTTGYYCPGCGGTRAIHALLHGHPLLSLRYHPFVPYAAALGGYFMLSQTISRLSRGKLAVALHFRQIYLWVGLILIVLNFLAKNLMVFFSGAPVL